MAIKPFRDRFGKALQVITGSARLGNNTFSLPQIGDKRPVKFLKAKKINLFNFSVSYSVGEYFDIWIPESVGGTGRFVQVQLVTTVANKKPDMNSILIQHSSDRATMASRLAGAINGPGRQSYVTYGRMIPKVSESAYIPLPPGLSSVSTGQMPKQYTGDNDNGIPGITAKFNSSTYRVTVIAAKYGYGGNQIRIKGSAAFINSGGKEKPFSGGSGNTDVMKTVAINKFRQGVSIRTAADFVQSLTPMLSNHGLPEFTEGAVDFETEQTVFGQGKLFKNSNSDGQISQFADVKGKFSAKEYLNLSTNIKYLEGYPVVLDNPVFNDPAQMDGIIEPLDIRQSLTNFSIFSPYPPHRIKASLHTGDFNGDDEGTCPIATVINRRQGKSDYFEDSQELRFPSGSYNKAPDISNSPHTNFSKATFSENGRVERQGLAIPGFISEGTAMLSPFVDDIIQRDYIPQSIVKIYGETKHFLTGSAVKNISEIGTVYKSAVCGFQFGPTSLSDSTVLGTDSIAFGGLKR